jgi:hypothetical protein
LPAYAAPHSRIRVHLRRRSRPELDYEATIHHGIDLEALPFSAARAMRWSFRPHSPGQGHRRRDRDRAARRRRLVICGIVQDDATFASRCSRTSMATASATSARSVRASAREVLGPRPRCCNPIAFAEPFGLSVVEAMACGTPVMAYPLGSMPEVIDVGVTGYLVADVEEAVAGVERAGSARPPRGAPHRRAAVRCGSDGPTTYLKLYQRLLAR